MKISKHLVATAAALFAVHAHAWEECEPKVFLTPELGQLIEKDGEDKIQGMPSPFSRMDRFQRIVAEKVVREHPPHLHTAAFAMQLIDEHVKRWREWEAEHKRVSACTERFIARWKTRIETIQERRAAAKSAWTSGNVEESNRLLNMTDIQPILGSPCDALAQRGESRELGKCLERHDRKIVEYRKSISEAIDYLNEWRKSLFLTFKPLD